MPMAPAMTNLNNQFPDDVTRIRGETSISRLSAMRLDGILTKQVPASIPIGAPMTPIRGIKIVEAMIETHPSANPVIANRRSWPKQNRE